MRERSKCRADQTKWSTVRASYRSLLAGAVLVVLSGACGTSRATSPGDVPSSAPHASASIDVEKVDGGFVVRNLTIAPIVCGVVGSIGRSPRTTVQIAAHDTARIDDGARHVVACEVELKTAAEIAGQTEEEWRRAMGVSSSEEGKLLLFEDRGTTSSSTAMLASSCETDDEGDPSSRSGER